MGNARVILNSNPLTFLDPTLFRPIILTGTIHKLVVIAGARSYVTGRLIFGSGRSSGPIVARIDGRYDGLSRFRPR